MSKELQTAANLLSSTEIKELLGPAPVLSSENEKSYKEILDRLMECLAPRDFMEQLLIKQLSDCTWEMARYVRHKTLSIERNYRLFREFQAKRTKALAQMKDARAHKLAIDEPATALGRMRELEDIVDETLSDIDAILEKPAKELDHARALEKSMHYHLQLDQAYNTAVARRNDTLEQLDRYRRGSMKRLRKASDDIIDAEFNDVAAKANDIPVTLVPSQEDGQ
jgi:hypothetical protein